MFFDQLFFFFLAVQHGLWDLSSQPRDGTWAPVVRDSLHGARHGCRGLLRDGSSSGRRAQRRLSPTSGFPLCPPVLHVGLRSPQGNLLGLFLSLGSSLQALAEARFQNLPVILLEWKWSGWLVSPHCSKGGLTAWSRERQAGRPRVPGKALCWWASLGPGRHETRRPHTLSWFPSTPVCGPRLRVTRLDLGPATDLT